MAAYPITFHEDRKVIPIIKELPPFVFFLAAKAAPISRNVSKQIKNNAKEG